MAGNPYWDKLVFGLHCDGTNGSTTFTDVKGKAVTANGNAQISTAQYPSTISGKSSSGYFDGSGDYLTTPTNTDFAFGTGDFTIGLLVYPTSFSVESSLIDVQVSGGVAARNDSFVLVSRATSGLLRIYSTSAYSASSSSGLTLNAWNHVLVSRSGTSFKVFVNGASVLSLSVSTNFSAGGCVIGKYADQAGGYLSGYISEVEIYKGIALYTSNFTPASDPFGEGYILPAPGVVSAVGNVPYFSYGATALPSIFVNT